MMALCHDVRMMREDRGYLCANEIQIGMAIPDAELSLFRHKMSGSAFFDTVQLARRWTGPDAKAAGFVQDVADIDILLDKTMDRARQLAPSAPTESSLRSRKKGFSERHRRSMTAPALPTSSGKGTASRKRVPPPRRYHE